MTGSDRRAAILRGLLGALVLLWAGILIGVSFLAAPAKFNAPSLSLPVAMDVGRQEFGALNLVESGSGRALPGAGRADPPGAPGLARPRRRRTRGRLAGALAAAGARRARRLIIEGATPPAAPWHALYIMAEVIKLLALLVAGWLALWRLRMP